MVSLQLASVPRAGKTQGLSGIVGTSSIPVNGQPPRRAAAAAEDQGLLAAATEQQIRAAVRTSWCSNPVLVV